MGLSLEIWRYLSFVAALFVRHIYPSSSLMIIFYLYNENPHNWKESLYNETGAMGIYRKVSNISRTLVGNKIVDHSDVVGASPVGAAPTTSSFST